MSGSGKLGGAVETGGGRAAGRGTLIAPSVLSCDLLRLMDQVREVAAGGADWLHIDVMDGHFVPAITFGPGLVEALHRATSLPLDVHLMVERPEEWVQPFAKAGAALISFHLEACRHPRRLLRHIRSLGVAAGLALNPATPPDGLKYLAAELDLVLVMSVDPGFAGQPFIPETIPKLGDVGRVLTAAGASGIHVEVDGGVGPANAGVLSAAGASVLVAGNSVFGQADPAAALRALRQTLPR